MRSPAHWLEVFRTWYGPVHKAFGALDADKQKALAEDIDSPPRREELVSGLQAVAVAAPDLEVLQATADELLADADLAWRSFACSLLVEELAGEPG